MRPGLSESQEHATARLFAFAAFAVLALTFNANAAEPIPSWNDGPTKKSITDFVARVAKEGSPDFVKPAERIAVFDNDGCLWCEQPMYFQLLFAIDRVKALAPRHRSGRTKSPSRPFSRETRRAPSRAAKGPYSKW